MTFLETVPLFEDIDPGIIREISEHSTKVMVQQGTVLFQKGDPAEYLYVLVEGSVDLTIEGKVHISFPVNEPGQVFGWSALVEPHQYTARAESSSETKVIKIRGDRLTEIFHRYPSEALIVMKRLAKVIASRPIGKFTLRYESP